MASSITRHTISLTKEGDEKLNKLTIEQNRNKSNLIDWLLKQFTGYVIFPDELCPKCYERLIHGRK